jgi:hypothetical protein
MAAARQTRRRAFAEEAELWLSEAATSPDVLWRLVGLVG